MRIVKLTAAMLLTGALVLASGSAASAGYNDGFTVGTAWDGQRYCATTEFVDYGQWLDGSMHEDYIVVHDYCGDGYGVNGSASVVDFNGNWRADCYTGGVQNSNSAKGNPVYKQMCNVRAGERITITVERTKNGYAYNHTSAQHVSQDG